MTTSMTSLQTTRPPALRAASVVLAALALTASGCGAADPEEQLRSSWEAFRQSLLTDNPGALCRLLTTQTRHDLESMTRSGPIDGPDTCEELFARFIDDFSAQDRKDVGSTRLLWARVSGKHGKTLVSAQDGEPTHWIRVDGQWRIDGTGPWG